MDFDDKINEPCIGDCYESNFFPSHFVKDSIPLTSYDPWLVKVNSQFQDDEDMNGDFTNDDGEEDSDNDGDGMSNGYEADRGIVYGGWQNPFIYNDKYAIIAFDSQIRHQRDMYDTRAVLEFHNFKDKNIGLFVNEKTPESVWGGITVTGGWEDIDESFSTILPEITENDMFFILYSGHKKHMPINLQYNSKDPKDNALQDYFDLLCGEENYLRVGRMAYFLQTCEAGATIVRPESKVVDKDLWNKDKFVYMCSSTDKQDSKAWSAPRDGSAFLHGGVADYKIFGTKMIKPGAMYSLRNDIHSLAYAFEKGSEAVEWYIEEINDDWDQTPLLEDNGEPTDGLYGVPYKHRYYNTNIQSDDYDGWLAKRTYL